ncbi:hypothetical protein [Vulcanisaeta thermophila]|uniref:hypothetical protein n=1 Tax=Vulcanisaeta thermophila TaxID=867917 RepID=UPI000853F01C|nr:hypothetical protein [Vulcanisaeta thermophila]
MALISVLGFDQCVDDENISCGGAGDSRVVIDLLGNVKSLLNSQSQLIITVNPSDLIRVKREVVGRIAVNGRPLRSIIGLGELDGEAVIKGVNGEAFGVRYGDKVILYATPLFLYLTHNHEVLVSEVRSLLDNVPVSVGIEDAVRELSSIIISERRSKRVSRTLALLEDLLQDGSIDEIPPYVMDILVSAGVVDGGNVNRDLLRRLVEEVKSRVYPRRV